jgi:hypothetical protein
MLVVGFALFFLTYEVYAHFLGGIDGLPALPRAYWPSNEALAPINEIRPAGNLADQKLRLAFGEDCDEVKKRTIKLIVSTKGLVLATDEVKVQPDGRVKLTPFSIAIFGKDRGDYSFPEITTVRCQEAYLTFDRPVTSQTDLSNRKIIGGELRSNNFITITNNRRTPQQTDDIEVTIFKKPLFYLEKEQRVWTEGFVRLLDTQNVPDRTEINAQGMDLYLSKSAAAPSAKDAKATKKNPRVENVSGVDRLVLHKSVRMDLYVDAKSGFLGVPREGRDPKTDTGRPRHENSGSGPERLPPVEESPAARKKTDPPKSHVVIMTNGPFTYDVPADIATYDIPPRSPAQRGKKVAEHVAVSREYELPQGGKQFDQLDCEHLELHFRRKAPSDAKAPHDKDKAGADPKPAHDDRSVDREIESAHATGEEVVLALDSEFLEARGQDMVYHCPTAARGPETTIKGNPLRAVKDCNIIQAQELWLMGSVDKSGSGPAPHQNAPARGSPQQARAKGPGQIDLADRACAAPRHPVHILWQDLLVSTKDGPYDLLTVTGDASFIDDDHDQWLRGEQLQVWLEPAERPGSPPRASAPSDQATPAAVDTARQRPHRLEAFRHVAAHAPELNIRETEHLLVWFKDVPPAAGELPAALPPATNAVNTSGQSTGKQATQPTGNQKSKLPSAGGKADPAAKKADQPAKKPVHLQGRSVVAYVNRVPFVDQAGTKNELQRVLTEGAVHVQQDGSTPQDKGVDIEGEKLELIRQGPVDAKAAASAPGDLYQLVVLGDSSKMARLQMGELFIVGPKVTIDQKENTAEVQGIGAMDMPSKTTLEGGKPVKPGTRLKVYWNQAMLFNGRDADFQGGVTATQDNARLLCNSMQVTLDRTVSLRQGQKTEQGAKVEKLVCDRKVNVQDTELDKNGKLLKFQELRCREMAVDNPQGRVNASGPGIVFLLQPGPVDPAAGGTAETPPQPQAKNAPPKEEMKLTRVEFEGRMLTDSSTGRRIARFWDNVEVVNLPAERVDVAVDKDRLPLRGMYLRCEKLTVFTSPQPDGKNSQNLIAETKVFVDSPDFTARAAKVSFEEAKDLIILEANATAKAVLYRKKGPGVPTPEIKGKKIYYWRQSKQYKIEDGGSIMNLD